MCIRDRYDVDTLKLNYRTGIETPEAKDQMDYQIKEVQRNCRYVEEDCEDAIQKMCIRDSIKAGRICDRGNSPFAGSVYAL